MYLNRTYLFVFALLFSSLLPATSAAKKEKGQGPAESDSIQVFRGVAVSYNVGGTIMRMVSDFGEYEATARVNFKDKYFPVFELGIGDAFHGVDPITGIEAKTTAPFFRIGCDYNIAKNKHDAYRVLFGARYGFSSFTQEAYGNITDPYWGGKVPYQCKTACDYHWAELVFSLDARMWGPIRMGWSFRYKFKIAGNTNNPGQEIWYIPGYGKKEYALGGTFNVSMELWRKNKKAKQ